MLISRYADQVAATDQFKDHAPEERRRISIYGLVSEIGSVVSAVKKQKLEKTSRWSTCRELQEELGDVIWYCFALAEIEGIGDDDILARQLESLSKQLESEDRQSSLAREQLDKDRIEDFRQRAKGFPRKRQGTFQEFQEIAYLTARIESDDLVATSLIELMSLAAQLMRRLLPVSERNLHDQIPDRPMLDVLEEIGWYLAAIATAYDLSLDKIADSNIQKAQLNRYAPLPAQLLTPPPTPLHDECYPEGQQLPRCFKVQFLTVGEGRSRMYYAERQLGDDLTDNFYEDDGYRFHDVLHLANMAHLGWSPVLRGLMKRKRKADPQVDEVEDGARAQIIEEAIVKVIHAEGKERSDALFRDFPLKDRPIFHDDVDIPFSLFKLIQRYAKGLEVAKNSFQEWETAIREGYRIYDKLKVLGQGTVTVNLNQRKISFHPDVHVNIPGTVAGIGTCTVSLSGVGEDEAGTWLTKAELDRWRSDGADSARLPSHLAAKRAILQALGFDQPTSQFFTALSLTGTDSGQFSVKAESPLKEILWDKGIVVIKTSFSRNQSSVYCTALALSDRLTRA